MNTLNFNLYKGNGETIQERHETLPAYEPMVDFDDASHYIAGEGLSQAVNVALTLGQPLLITGEPGTGKTELAKSIAWELGIPKLDFFTKTTSTATDLFYQYDALRRFQDAHLPEHKHLTIHDYIQYQALGQAILLSYPPEEVKHYLPAHLLGKGPTRSVVLIDEIDKAPRDLPNDILNEVEDMQFTVKETGQPFRAPQQFRPMLVLTSNSEKNLPDAFLRRCIFYHITFPTPSQLREIVQRRFQKYPDFTPDFIDAACTRFMEIRDLTLKKKPATAEFLSWIQVLRTLGVEANDILKGGKREMLAIGFSILAKNREDFALLRKKFIQSDGV